jgi:Spy/CpxP family protein refolding chaperone
MTRRLMVVVGLALALVVGAQTAWSVAEGEGAETPKKKAKVAREKPKRVHGKLLNRRELKKLDLTDEQKGKLITLEEEYEATIKENFAEVLERLGELRKQMRELQKEMRDIQKPIQAKREEYRQKAVAEILTAEQKETFAEMQPKPRERGQARRGRRDRGDEAEE